MNKLTLSEAYPEIAAQWHPTKNGSLTPDQVTPGKGQEVWWQCHKGHEWQAVIGARTNGTGCPYCTGKRPIPGETDLASVNPQLAKEWHPDKNGTLTPVQVKPLSNKKVWWLGTCGHEWEATIYNRNRGSGCPYCSGIKLIPGQTDLASRNPSLAAQWHPTKNGMRTPNQVKPYSERKAWWLCPTCGHEWLAPIKNRHQGTSCPVCASGRRTKTRAANRANSIQKKIITPTS